MGENQIFKNTLSALLFRNYIHKVSDIASYFMNDLKI